MAKKTKNSESIVFLIFEKIKNGLRIMLVIKGSTLVILLFLAAIIALIMNNRDVIRTATVPDATVNITSSFESYSKDVSNSSPTTYGKG